MSSSSSTLVTFEHPPATTTTTTTAAVNVVEDPRKELLLNGSLDKLPRACDSMEELIQEVRKYSDNDVYFLEIFPLFLLRVLGENVIENSLESNWVRGEKGGWLKRAAESTRSGYVTLSASQSSSRSRRTDRTNAFMTRYGMTDYAARLLHLFVPGGCVSKILDDDHYNHYVLNANFDILPKKVKMKLQGVQAYRCIRSATHHVMYDQWCHRSREVVSALMSTPNHTNSQAGTRDVDLRINTGSVNNCLVSVPLKFYYFMLFLRYPTVELEVFPQRGRNDLFAKLFNDNDNVARWSRGNPYLHLLGEYMHCYLPLKGSCSPAAHDTPDHSAEFLQFAIDYWIDSVLVVKHDFDSVASHKDDYLKQGTTQLRHTSSSSRLSSPNSSSVSGFSGNGRGNHYGTPRSASNPSPRNTQRAGIEREHPSATEVVALENISNKAFLPTRNTMQCIYMLVHHCMTRMTADFLEREIHYQTTQQQKYSSHRRGDLLLDSLPIPYTMMAMQQPLFDLLRVIFKADSIDREVFVLAVQVWHLWITPWRRTNRQVGRSSNERSKMKNLEALKSVVTESVLKDAVAYDAKTWEYYVATNFHFYSTLFVLFLQSPTLTRDIAITSNVDGVVVLSKTLNLFSGPLLMTIDYLNKGYALAQRDKGCSFCLSDMSDAHELNGLLRDVITLQDRQLFPGLSFHESCAVVDFRRLTRSQSKSVIEILRGRGSGVEELGFLESGMRSLIDSMMTLCGIPVTVLSADRFHDLKRIETTLAEISCLRASDLIGLGVRPSGDSKTVEHDAERVSELSGSSSELGTLTPRGKSQILHGMRVCDRASIAYRKDPMSRPFLSTDVNFAVKYLVRMSKSWNDCLDLPACKDSVYLSWSQLVAREIYRYESKHGACTRHAVVRILYNSYLRFLMTCRSILLGFRFNVRCFGNVIFLCKLCFFISSLSYYFDLLKGNLYAGVMTLVFITLKSFGWF